jgi:hypothetical protein
MTVKNGLVSFKFFSFPIKTILTVVVDVNAVDVLVDMAIMILAIGVL